VNPPYRQQLAPADYNVIPERPGRMAVHRRSHYCVNQMLRCGLLLAA